jgi:DNA polymerase-1
MITKDGVYTQGIYGFLTMFEKIMKDYPSGYAVVAFDRKTPTFRHEEFKEYKAGRKKMPEELVMQLPLLKDVLDAMNVKRLEIDGYEADDIIGTVARRAEGLGLEPLIITGDKDELQLATETTKVLITRKGTTEFDIYDKAAIYERYGFSPTEFIDFKGLMGDKSDNIPGVPGIGEKTANRLIREFGNVENLLMHLEQLEGKLRSRLEENAGLARLSRRLSEIDTNVPIETDFEEFKLGAPDRDALVALYVRLEFNSLLGRMRNNPVVNGASAPTAVLAAAVGAEARIAAAKTAYAEKKKRAVCRIVREAGDIKALEEAVTQTGDYALCVFSDNNHVNKPLIYGISIMLGNVCFYVSLETDDKKAFVKELFKVMKGRALLHNALPEMYALESSGLGANIRLGFDTALGQYLLDPSRKDYSLDVMALEHMQMEFKDEREYFAAGEQLDMLQDETARRAGFGLERCLMLEALSDIIRTKLEAENLLELYEEAELPLVAVLASMETEGFYVDKDELGRVGDGLSRGISGISEKIYALAGERFNINSPVQLGAVMFDKLGLPPSKKTKTGYSTSADVLEKLADKHEIVGAALEYRTLAKLYGTYVEGLLPLIGPDNRIHAHFQQMVTATGRISCTEPNLQNIPVRQEAGREIRRAFIAGAGSHVLVGADYSQIELRVLAHLSRDAALMEDFRQGADIHRRTAARVFGMAEDEIDVLHRSRAKAVNFGVVYGMSGFGLSEGLGISRKEAELYIEEYFKTHKAVRDFMDEQIRFCREHGYVTTILGRRRWIPEIKASQYTVRQLGERLAMNTPVQGSAADIIKLAMIKVNHALRAKNLESKLILQVHDELIIEARLHEIDLVSRLLKESMESAIELAVPLTVELKSGSSWYELK